MGIKKSRGAYIAFCDSDDIWDREKLKTQLTLMGRQKFSLQLFT